MAAANAVVNGLINEMLPPEVLEKIFAFCNVKNDILKFADVCQWWRDVICQHVTEFNVDLSFMGNVNDLVTLLARADKVIKLQVEWKIEDGVIWRNVPLAALDGSISALNYQIKALKEAKPRFRCVTVVDVFICREDHVSNLGLLTLLPRIDSVTKLTIRECDHNGDDLPVVSLDIPHGSLSNVTSLNDLESFRLVIKEYSSGPDSLVHALLTLLEETSCRTLTRLELHINAYDTVIGWKVAQVLEACRHLTHLTLYDAFGPVFGPTRCVEIIPTLTHLESLDIQGYSLTPLRLPQIANIKSGCRNLSSIMLSSLVLRPEDTNFRLLQFFSYIEKLIVEDMGSDQLRLLLTHLRDYSDIRVDRLDVSERYAEAAYITDDILLSLIETLCGVTHVSADGCQHLTNEGVVNIITSSATLEEIVVDGIRNISDALIQLLEDVTVTGRLTVSAEVTTLSEQMGEGELDVGGIIVKY